VCIFMDATRVERLGTLLFPPSQDPGGFRQGVHETKWVDALRAS